VKRYYPTKLSETNVRSNYETTGLQNICGDNTSDETMFTFLKVRHFFLGFVVTVVFSPRTFFFHQLHIVPKDIVTTIDLSRHIWSLRTFSDERFVPGCYVTGRFVDKDKAEKVCYSSADPYRGRISTTVILFKYVKTIK
jgi:hypothetical protein